MTGAMILGGELNGTVYDGYGDVAVYEMARPNNYYDPTGETRPFAIDHEVRTLPVERAGITLNVVIDGDESVRREALRLLNETVRDLFFKRWMEGRS